jgi:hypothetical protein
MLWEQISRRFWPKSWFGWKRFAAIPAARFARVGRRPARVVVRSVGGYHLNRWFVLVVIGSMLVPSIVAAQSTTKNRTQRWKPADVSMQADGLVKDALYYEIYGDKNRREKLLSEASKVSPNFAPARWQSGHVKLDDRWVKTDEVSELAANNAQLARYTAKRNESSDTPTGHLSLARWCEARGLDQQARAHYSNVLDFQSDHAEARGKLGFRRLNGVWVTEAEMNAVNEQAKQFASAIENWSSPVSRIREGLQSNNERNRKAAEQELAKIEDLSAIPVLERALSAASEASAVRLVNKLAGWRDPQATRSLTRQAIYSPWEAVRQLASHKLQGRPYEEYVPTLLDQLRTAVQVGNTFFRAGDQLVLREFFVREGASAWELLTIDTAYTREARRGGDSNDTLSRAITDMRRTAATRQVLASAQNGEQSQLNERIIGCLTLATGQTTRVSPEDWWNWWNSENEMSDSGAKPVNSQYDRDRRYLIDRVVEQSPPPSTEGVRLVSSTSRPFGPARAECLAAGTPVWTITGTQPIEQIRIGDLVLAQDTETGELAYKAVLRRTVRPAGPVFQVDVDGQTYRASGGHLFWVTGEGWVKARHLRSGNVLHCCGGTASVNDAKEAASEPTYNLVVADFSTYFVGPDKILSHDVTLRQPTRAIVPGLPRE